MTLLTKFRDYCMSKSVLIVIFNLNDYFVRALDNTKTLIDVHNNVKENLYYLLMTSTVLPSLARAIN